MSSTITMRTRKKTTDSSASESNSLSEFEKLSAWKRALRAWKRALSAWERALSAWERALSAWERPQRLGAPLAAEV